jgi:hypothetical protein
MNARLLLVFSLILLMTSCTSLMPHRPGDLLTLRVTTKDVLTGHLGSPIYVDSLRDNSGTALLEEYRLRDEKGRPPEVFRGAWKIAREGVYCEIIGDTLHGYITNNSTEKSPTAFQQQLRHGLKMRHATQADVMQILGEPAGRTILPSRLFQIQSLSHLDHVVPTKAAVAWYYYYDYFYFKPRLRERFHYYRFLALYFDGTGKVIDKFYSESDLQEPHLTRLFTQ